jgi:hypothetical protein
MGFAIPEEKGVDIIANKRRSTVMKETWEKIFEYASMPVHGTLSRKLRKGVSLQVNDGKVYSKAVVFLGDSFVRITEEEGDAVMNSYFDWAAIQSIRTTGAKEKQGE